MCLGEVPILSGRTIYISLLALANRRNYTETLFYQVYE